MIHSVLDQDFYTLTVCQAILECFPDAVATFEFKDRKRLDFTSEFYNEFVNSVGRFSGLKLLPDERRFLETSVSFLKPHFHDYLSNYRYNPDEVSPALVDNKLNMHVSGSWHHSMWWEVPLLFTVSDTYYRTVDIGWSDDDQDKMIARKSEELYRHKIHFADFGTRRRRNYASQDRVVRIFKDNPFFVGTSNVHFAHKYGVRPIGTMSHQWIMGNAALESLRYANRYALRNWNRVYNGDLGIALPDTYGTAAFFEDFDSQLARLFDGVRHDSGDPLVFADNVVAHYKRLRIDPSSKTIVFSDGLDVEAAVRISEHCRNIGIKASFGIGTSLTNSYAGSPPLNIVIKLKSLKKHARSNQEVQVVKLSDDVGKAVGDPDALRVALWTFFNQPLNR